MGLEKTAERIREGTRAECERILGEANSAADATLEAARQEGRKVADRMLAKGRDDAKFAGERIITDARMAAGRKRMRMHSELISAAIGSSLRELERFAAGREYLPFLEKLAVESVSLLGGKQAIVCLRKKDAKLLDLKKLSKDTGVGLQLSKQSLAIPGVVVESIDGRVKVDNTFSARLKRDEGAIKKIVSEALFAGGG